MIGIVGRDREAATSAVVMVSFEMDSLGMDSPGMDRHFATKRC